RKKVIAHYKWLNPNLVLPSRKQLAGRILKNAVEINRTYIQDKAQIETSIKKHKQNNIALPLPTLEKNTNLHDHDCTSTFNDDSDDEIEDEECESTINADNWNGVVEQWISMISEEDLTNED
ncbi:18652_t:CDS:2, partial [Gigaspora rosea]